MKLPDVDYYMPIEVAVVMRITPAKVAAHCKAKDITASKVGRKWRISKAELARIKAAMDAGMDWRARPEDATPVATLRAVGPEPEQVEWITTQEAAALLGRSDRQVQRMAKAGKLTANTNLKPFRVLKSDVEEMRKVAA